jgi:hypothetical protein
MFGESVYPFSEVLLSRKPQDLRKNVLDKVCVQVFFSQHVLNIHHFAQNAAS